jgi:protein-tyrosine phosphatase
VIDLHSHILPGVDDGAPNLEIALDMARMAVADGIEVMACTPHFMPGLYDNETSDIEKRFEDFRARLQDTGIGLELVIGSDAHIRPDFVSCLREHRIPTLNNSRYVLFEPPHVTMPQRMDDLLFEIAVAGFIPILTHPERLKWIEHGYDILTTAAQNGVWMQITAGSLTGRFGNRAQYWAQRMLSEGLVSIMATDAHDLTARPPKMSNAFKIVAQEVGAAEADNVIFHRPLCILQNANPEAVPALPAPRQGSKGIKAALRRLLGVS